MSIYKSISLSSISPISIDEFKEMDFIAVKEYKLPIELMMENAGLNLAMLVSSFIKLGDTILIGVGNGNNGGGGLVAARRLAAWGYDVYLDIPTSITKELPLLQLDRALQFGVKIDTIANPTIWVDAYLGFSQHLPLDTVFEEKINMANDQECIRISLDLPTGFLGDPSSTYFNCHHVLSLGGLKDVLLNLPDKVFLFIADLGMPKEVYQNFNAFFPAFNTSSIFKIKV
jgi:NAD(P)H-hydrate epimerase